MKTTKEKVFHLYENDDQYMVVQLLPVFNHAADKHDLNDINEFYVYIFLKSEKGYYPTFYSSGEGRLITTDGKPRNGRTEHVYVEKQNDGTYLGKKEHCGTVLTIKPQFDKGKIDFTISLPEGRDYKYAMKSTKPHHDLAEWAYFNTPANSLGVSKTKSTAKDDPRNDPNWPGYGMYGAGAPDGGR